MKTIIRTHFYILLPSLFIFSRMRERHKHIRKKMNKQKRNTWMDLFADLLHAVRCWKHEVKYYNDALTTSLNIFLCEDGRKRGKQIRVNMNNQKLNTAMDFFYRFTTFNKAQETWRQFFYSRTNYSTLSFSFPGRERERNAISKWDT